MTPHQPARAGALSHSYGEMLTARALASVDTGMHAAHPLHVMFNVLAHRFPAGIPAFVTKMDARPHASTRLELAISSAVLTRQRVPHAGSAGTGTTRTPSALSGAARRPRRCSSRARLWCSSCSRRCGNQSNDRTQQHANGVCTVDLSVKEHSCIGMMTVSNSIGQAFKSVLCCLLPSNSTVDVAAVCPLCVLHMAGLTLRRWAQSHPGGRHRLGMTPKQLLADMHRMLEPRPSPWQLCDVALLPQWNGLCSAYWSAFRAIHRS